MKKILVSALLLAAGLWSAQNTLLDAGFWKKNPDLATVKSEIAKGNTASEMTPFAMDAVVTAIINGASPQVVEYLAEQPGNSPNKLTHDSRNYLHWAAYIGSPELVKYFIAKGSDLNLVDSHGATPLSFSALSGKPNTEVYDAFFAAGIDPKMKYEDGASLLLLSMPNDKDLKITDYLLKKGFSLSETDENGATAFDYAARSGDLDYLKKLQARGVKYTDHALLMAASGSRRASAGLDVYKYLIEDLKLKASAADQDGNTVLHLIARRPGQEEIIKYFISKGADAGKPNKDGETPLMLAAANRNLAAVQVLAANVKNINAVNEKGESALNYAAATGSPEILQYLIRQNVKTGNKDLSGNTVVYSLINGYRAPRPNSDEKDTFAEKLAMLKAAGVNLAAPQAEGNTAYQLAAAKNDLALLEHVSATGADINAKNRDGMTALHKAALTAKDDTVLKYLIAHGAKKDIKDEFGETAYDLAKENQYLRQNSIDINFLK